MLTPQWCRIRDLNPYAIRHQNLNLTCLPIPPIRHMAAPVGFEPTTLRLTAACSASWAKGPYLRKRKVSVLQTVSFHYTSSPVRITDGVISLMTISPSLSSSFFILYIYYIIFFIKNQKRFFNGDRVGFDTNIIHRFFTLTKNYFSDLIPPRSTAVVLL